MFAALGNKFENEWIFGVDLDPKFMGCQREVTHNFGLVNSLTADG